LPNKEGEIEKEKMRVSTEEQTPWHVLRETRIKLCSPGYMVDLAATKALNYRDILQLLSK
jgi:hypothetical protein